MKPLFVLAALFCCLQAFCANSYAPKRFNHRGYNRIDLALSSGFVWKQDGHFKHTYGKGIPNWITIDGCCWFYKHIGLGITTSYWEKEAKHGHKKMQEVPLVLYLRGKIGGALQGYASLGGGVIFAHEKTGHGTDKKNVGGGQAEIGINYFFSKNYFVTAAGRYLYFRKSNAGETKNFGGTDLRAGIGVSF